MTAQRWWVRLAARWLARIDGVSGQLRLAMLGLTGVSTATLTLQSYGYGEYSLPFIALLSIGGIAFTYLYAEGGVWNQVSRDRRDLSSNFADPKVVIGTEMDGRAMLSGIKGRPLTDEERQAVRDEVNHAFAEFRDGIDIDENGRPRRVIDGECLQDRDDG